MMIFSEDFLFIILEIDTYIFFKLLLIIFIGLPSEFLIEYD